MRHWPCLRVHGRGGTGDNRSGSAAAESGCGCTTRRTRQVRTEPKDPERSLGSCSANARRQRVDAYFREIVANIRSTFSLSVRRAARFCSAIAIARSTKRRSSVSPSAFSAIIALLAAAA